MGINEDGTWDGLGEEPDQGPGTAPPDSIVDPVLEERTNNSTLGTNVADTTASNFDGLGEEVATVDTFDDIGAKTDVETNAKVNEALSDENGEGGYVDDRSTVQGQLQSLLASDSPYIKQAELAGERQAAGRGMLNSSMAAGATRAEAYKAGLPIAAQDAETHAKAQQAQQATENKQKEIMTEGIVSGGLQEQQGNIAASSQAVQNTFAAAIQGASEANKVLLADMQDLNNKFAASFDADFQLLMKREELTASQTENIATQASTVMQNYSISIENLMTDPDFLSLGKDAMNNAVEQMQILASNSVKAIGAMGGVPMDSIVDQYIYSGGSVGGETVVVADNDYVTPATAV